MRFFIVKIKKIYIKKLMVGDKMQQQMFAELQPDASQFACETHQ